MKQEQKKKKKKEETGYDIKKAENASHDDKQAAIIRVSLYTVENVVPLHQSGLPTLSSLSPVVNHWKITPNSSAQI